MGLWEKLFGATKVVQPVRVDDRNFTAEVLHSKVPVLLDVWSEGCAPCRQMETVVMDLATRYQGRVKVAEMCVSTAPQTVGRLNVRGTPTLIYFKDGAEYERVVGMRSSLYHRELIDQELLASAEQHAPA